MIESFADQGSEDIWRGVDTKRARKLLAHGLWAKAAVLMDRIDAATSPADLRLPPGNGLHALKDDLAGYWAVKVNAQFRIIFKFQRHNAQKVQVTDYH